MSTHPATIRFEKLGGACRALDLDPRDVRELHLDPSGFSAVLFDRGPDGKRIPLPDDEQGEDGHWFRSHQVRVPVANEGGAA